MRQHKKPEEQTPEAEGNGFLQWLKNRLRNPTVWKLLMLILRVILASEDLISSDPSGEEEL